MPSDDRPVTFEEIWSRAREEYPDENRAMRLQRGKQDWQVPVTLYIRGAWSQVTARGRFYNHRLGVESALLAGKPVPPAVLRDYPDLTHQSSSSTSSATKTGGDDVYTD